MKKLFTFLLLMLCSIGVSWAATGTEFSATAKAAWKVPGNTIDAEITSTYATISGGKMYLTSKQSAEKEMIKKQSNVIAFQHTNNDTFFKVVLDSPLKAGDIINARMQTRTDTDLGLWFSTATSRPSSEPTAKIVLTKTTAQAWVDAPSYTVTTGDGICGETTFYIYLHTGKSTYFTDFTINKVPFDFTANGYTNAQDITTIERDGVTITYAKANGNNAPKYYTSGTAIRAYNGNTITFTAPAGKGISKIEFTQSGNYFDLSANTGSLTEKTWTGNSAEVVFTNGSSSQTRLQKVRVTLAELEEGSTSLTSLPQELTFPDNNDDPIASYVADEAHTWTATLNGGVWTFCGFNNNNNSYDYVACGRKRAAVTSTITSPAVEPAVKYVMLKVRETNYVEKAYIEMIDSYGDLDESRTVDFTLTAGDVIIPIDGQEGYSYRIVIVNTAGENGSTKIDLIGLYDKDPGKIEVASIADFKALDNDTEAELTLNKVQVLFVNGKDVIVRDATGAIDFYNVGLDVKTNQVLNGVLYGKRSVYSNIPELVTCSKTDLSTVTITDGDAVKGTVVSVADAQKEANLMNLVTLENVTIAKEGNNFYAVNGDDKMQVYDKYKVGYTIEDGTKLKSITGIVVPYKEIYELAPRFEEDIVVAPEPISDEETGTETDQDTTIPNKNIDIVGTSYTIPGTYNAGVGNMLGTMEAKGFKCRTNQDGNRLVINVTEGYTINKLVIVGQGNYALPAAARMNDVTELAANVYVAVAKVEVDGQEVAFTGGNFPDKTAATSETLTIDNIQAKESVAIYFDNTNAQAAGGYQINMNYAINWSKPVEKPRETMTFDFQELCMQLGKGGPWAVNDGGDAGFTIGEGETAATMHYLGNYDNFDWQNMLAYEYVADRLKFTMRNKNNTKDKNCGMFSWDNAHYFSMLELQNGDKVTITIPTGTVNFVSDNVEGVAAGDAVTSDQTYTIKTTEKTTRLDIQMQTAALIGKIVIEPAGTETVPEIAVSKQTLALIPGATLKLTATVAPASIATQWKSDNEAVATVDEEGNVTAVAAGTANIINYWQSETSDAKAEAACVVTVADIDLSTYTVVKSYDFAAMGDVELTISDEAAGNIYNAANSKNNPVYFCTNEGLELIAVQAVAGKTGKGWSISDGEGLYLGSGAGRCAAVGGITANQIVEIIYTGADLYTSDSDDGVAKTALNEGVGRAIFQATEDGMLGFELVKNNYISKINIYEDPATAITTVKTQAQDNDAVYNLKGQRVQNPVKGLYIINGRKVVVK